MPPVDEDEFTGTLQVRCDYQTYLAFYRLSDRYYNYEDALRDMMRVVDENPEKARGRGPMPDLDLPESDKPPTWG